MLRLEVFTRLWVAWLSLKFISVSLESFTGQQALQEQNNNVNESGNMKKHKE